MWNCWMQEERNSLWLTNTFFFCSTEQVIFFPNRYTFGKKSNFIIEASDLLEGGRKWKSLCGLDKRILSSIDFGCLFRYEKNGQNNPGWDYWVWISFAIMYILVGCTVKLLVFFCKVSSSSAMKCVANSKNACIENSQAWKLFEKLIPTAASCYKPLKGNAAG